MEEQAFCLACQKEMKKYPVDPNIVVQIPTRKQTIPKKTIRRRVTLEDQVRHLKILAWVMSILFLVALISSIFLTISLLKLSGSPQFQIGQNYTIVKPTTDEIVENSVNTN